MERLLIGIFENPALDFSQNRAEHDDILGDAYEYLARASKVDLPTPSAPISPVMHCAGISSERSLSAEVFP